MWEYMEALTAQEMQNKQWIDEEGSSHGDGGWPLTTVRSP